jgi:hypothetical protein
MTVPASPVFERSGRSATGSAGAAVPAPSIYPASAAPPADLPAWLQLLRLRRLLETDRPAGPAPGTRGRGRPGGRADQGAARASLLGAVAEAAAAGGNAALLCRLDALTPSERGCPSLVLALAAARARHVADHRGNGVASQPPPTAAAGALGGAQAGRGAGAGSAAADLWRALSIYNFGEAVAIGAHSEGRLLAEACLQLAAWLQVGNRRIRVPPGVALQDLRGSAAEGFLM